METITPYVYLHKHSKAYSSSNHLDNSEQWENAVILQWKKIQGYRNQYRSAFGLIKLQYLL